jgi:hypothetical protein
MKSLFFAAAVAATAGQPAELVQSQAQLAQTGLADRFMELCGSDQLSAARLPGEDVQLADAPFQLKYYAEGAISARVVRMGDQYAMRSQNPARGDPAHAVILRCAVTSKAQFSDEVNRLSEKLAVKPELGKTGNGADYASFRSGLRAFNVYAEKDEWVSIFSLDIVMRNIDPKYLKKGAKPTPVPPAQ